MIRYSLRCDQGHDFDGWFRSSEGFESLRTAGQVSCALCGSIRVEKALMAPNVATRAATAPDLQSPQTEQEKALADLRRQVEENSDYVGMSFAAEARAMHDGTKPERAIHGEAKLEDARKLLEDGIPVAPLPFTPRHRTN
ncbi:DUF1178 family protein [Paracoccus aminophilus]|uniref:DUF1178 family protein n=1 Tax=Paracoccus aminophilus JCM 7686 TaxID=1367847 RepID=S5XXI8_PARAH|nr:DUF1178 family protein [Paracoccus aminophilus]AGT10007.1 hypothetical protein JCM7686_2971 [Paracoccus aminophilus JCM 7686]